MAQVAEVKFGDLQMDKRYKKLDRTLKLASLRKRSTKGNESWPSLTSPSISSINPDPLDSSNCIPSLHSSRIGSIVSSSNNLKDILLRKVKDLGCNHKRMTTSSVKKLDKESDWLEDRIIMPPPAVDKVLHSSKKLNNLSPCKVAKSMTVLQKQCNAPDQSKSEQDNNYKLSYENQKYDRMFNTLQSATANIQSGKGRTFRKWKVMLNDRCQLLIKGTLECGQVARSKPVVRRLTSTTVESIFKHAYHLQGNIVDDEYELPDYVRGKFYNGFPDDWENVYQIWKNFVQEGSIVTFRWPTPVADSDDDLKSEMTDITLAYSKSPKDKMSDLNSFKESHLSSFAHDCTYNILQTRKKQAFDLHNLKKCDSFTQTHALDSIDSSFSAQSSVLTSRNHFSNDKENYNKQEAAAANQSHVDSKVNSLKEKLNVIVNNLTDKNCPQECITKIIEMFDCLNYVVSHGSFKNASCPETGYDECAIQEEHNRVEDVSLDSVQQAISVPLKNTTDNNTTNCHNLLQKKRTFTEMDKDGMRNASDSESEIYTGIPKISMERILRQKETLMKPCKRKVRKRAGSPKQGTAEKQCASDISPVTPNCITENYTSSTRSKELNAMNDSSVSITEDEGKNRRVDRYIGRSEQNNVNKHIESDRARRWKREHLDNSLKNRNQLEMQEHFVEDNAPSEPTEFRHRACGALERNERDSGPENGNNEATESSFFYGEANSAKRNGITNYQLQRRPFCQQSEKPPSSSMDIKKQITKPVILSSIPVTSISNNHLNDIAQVQKAIKDLKEGIKRYEINSPTKLIDNKGVDSNLLRGTKQQVPEERVKAQLNDTDCSTKKLLRDNVQASQSNQPTEISNPKLLSAWTPKVLCKPELHLIFEGKLLNEAGHVAHRKFKTDIVLRRVSQKLIETIHHDFYQLVGDLNDTKHVVPKELLNQCRYGCPVRIEEFCKAWNALQRADGPTDVTAKLNETSVDAINVAVSSKGRRIIPPLSYWTGERIALRDNNPVYSPGNLQDSLTIRCNESFAKNTSAKNTKQGRTDKKKKDSVIESENISPSSSGILVNDSETRTSKTEQNRPKEPRKRNQRIVAQKLSDSSEDDCTSVRKRKKTRTRQQGSSNSTRVPSKQDIRSPTTENLHESGFNTAESTPRKMRTRGSKEALRTSASYINSSKETTRSSQLSAEKYHDVIYTYYQDIPVKDDVLSDDQVSHV